MFRILALLFTVVVVAQPVQARWYEASSEHFVIYADDSEKDVRRFAEDLEKFHAAMESVSGRDLPSPSPSNRVTIFVVGDQDDIRDLYPGENKNVAGFYIPRAGASRAFVQDIRLKRGYPSFSTVILLHEYAHHFLISSSRYGMPRWLSEGAAEFYASASFEKNGTVRVGRPAQHRALEIAYATPVAVEELLDADLYEARRGKRYDAFYGWSWALYHLLIFDENRAGQFSRYWMLLSTGSSSLEAGREAFGDLSVLQRELERYVRQRSMLSFVLPPEKIPFGPVSIRELSAGEAEMMEVRIRSQRGVSREEALEVVVDARAIAARYPDDPGVQTALAEAEFDAGFDDAAIAAADRALASDPSRVNAYVQKAYALFSKASEAEDADAAYQAAMKPLSDLNKLEPDHPAPLIYYYRTFVERGVAPSDLARSGILRAAQLSPFDMSLAMNAALIQAAQGQIADAKIRLHPLAMNPHGGGLSEQAKLFLADLEAADEGRPWFPGIGATYAEDVSAED